MASAENSGGEYTRSQHLCYNMPSPRAQTHMIKKILLTLLSLSLITIGGAYLFKDQLMNAITADMFVDADTDSFDPGLAVGQTFPRIKAIYQGAEITDAGSLIHDKGMVFITNRSADW